MAAFGAELPKGNRVVPFEAAEWPMGKGVFKGRTLASFRCLEAAPHPPLEDTCCAGPKALWFGYG